jgi:dTDP-D-glucose 4,6-dehydratase
MILVTGGAGFIGGNFILDWLKDPESESIINLDKLTYAGNLKTLESIKKDPRHLFIHGDIGDKELVTRLLREHQPRAIVNFAAETHVDRSIDGPAEFVQTSWQLILPAAGHSIPWLSTSRYSDKPVPEKAFRLLWLVYTLPARDEQSGVCH